MNADEIRSERIWHRVHLVSLGLALILTAVLSTNQWPRQATPIAFIFGMLYGRYVVARV